MTYCPTAKPATKARRRRRNSRASSPCSPPRVSAYLPVAPYLPPIREMWVGTIGYPHSYPRYKHGFYRILANVCGLSFTGKPLYQGVPCIRASPAKSDYGGHPLRQPLLVLAGFHCQLLFSYSSVFLRIRQNSSGLTSYFHDRFALKKRRDCAVSAELYLVFLSSVSLCCYGTDYFFTLPCQESLSVTVRLKMGAPGAESIRSATK